MQWLLGIACAALILGHARPMVAASVEFIICETANSLPIPCRIHVADSAGQPVKATNLPMWRDHFVCDGHVALALSPGNYRYVIERGPEYASITGRLEVANAPLRITNHLARLANLAAEGWWSGETHVHRAPADVELLMAAEDLHVAGVQTWWNNTNPWRTKPPPDNCIVQLDGTRFYDVMSG